ncbi:hypothetical protein HAX54_029499 [Datura stramonium]|uniref:Tify domain-containing protein n=1 Tax=Datura stramonium TaxID=4076 RepID=A0ABS8V8E0_DATST|nr:hypothetical protein [Datura stramonium]
MSNFEDLHQAFQNKGPLVLKDIGALTDGETGGGVSSRIEQKRAHQFFMDASEGELFSNKKQALLSVSDTPISTPEISNFFWSNTSNFQSAPVHSSDRSCAPEPLGTFNFGNKGLFSLGNENVKSERSRFIDLLLNNSTVGLSMSHAGEDPSYLNAGTREARINLADEHTSDCPFRLWKSSNIGEDSINATSLGLTYGAGIGNVISMGHNYAKEKQTASLIDSRNYKVNCNCMLMGHQYSSGDSNLYLMDQSLDTEEGYYRTANQPYKENGNFMPIPSYRKTQEDFISLFPSYRKANEDFRPVGMAGNKEIHVASRIPTRDKVVVAESANGSKQKGKKTPKSPRPRNNFPSNVKSLMSTGILDGVPVKYVSWSRDKTAKGIIKGTGYLCGCNDCKMSKARSLNAFEFESHADSKTKHPNSHIYFENGKSIYAVVKELKNTPQEVFFEVIQNITGSPINQKNFQTWKGECIVSPLMPL